MFADRQLQKGFTLGLFRPEDAPGIVDCYREVYGDTFPVRYVYDAGAIVERNSEGGQYTLVVREIHDLPGNITNSTYKSFTVQ